MDIEELFKALNQLKESNFEVIEKAREYLHNANNIEGFLYQLLEIAKNNEIDSHSRQLASIIFKDYALRRWIALEGYPQLTQNEKDKIKEIIVSAFIGSPRAVRGTLGVVLKEILKCEFPDNWPKVVDDIVNLLFSDNQEYVYAGVEVFNVFCNRLKFCDNIEYIDSIVSKVFPFLKKLIEYLMNMDDEMSNDMKLWIIKSFRNITYFKVSPHFLNNETFESWIEIFLTILRNNPPYESGKSLGDKHILFKQKKWCSYIFTRYVSRYCRKRNDDNKYAIAFREMFLANSSKQYADLSLNLLLSYTRKEIYFPKRIVTILLNYLAIGVLNSKIWSHIKPNFLNIFQELVIPIVSLSQDDIEIMESDPHEWIRMEHDPIDEYCIPKYPAIDIITTCIEHRSFDSLDEIMNIILNCLNRYMEDPLNFENACMKFGILEILKRLFKLLSENVKYSGSLEELLVNYVFPDFQSPYPFIASKTNDLLAFYADIEFNNEENILTILNFILQSMNSEHLIVSVEGTLALRHYIKYPNVQSVLLPILPDLFRRYFELMDSIDNDDLVSSLQEILYYFGESVGDYSIELTKVLSTHFMRIKSIASVDDDILILTCINILGALHTIIKAIRKRPDLIKTVQDALVPVIIDIVREECPEFIDDLVHILVDITYYTPMITEDLWTIYDHLMKAVVTWSPDYIENYLPIFDNMISHDTNTFLNSNRLEIIYNVFRFFIDDLNRALVESAYACQLIEIVFYQCRGKIDHAIPHFIETTLQRYKSTDSVGLRVFLLEVIINAMYNSPLATLNALESSNNTQYVLKEIYELASNGEFKRKHDKRCMIFGLSTLLEIPYESLPDSIKSLYKDLIVLIMNITKESTLQTDENKGEDEELERHLAKISTSSILKEYQETPDDEDVDSDDGLGYDEICDYLINRNDDDVHIESFDTGELPTDKIKESVYFLERFEKILNNNNQVRQMFNEEEMNLYKTIVELSKGEQ